MHLYRLHYWLRVAEAGLFEREDYSSGLVVPRFVAIEGRRALAYCPAEFDGNLASHCLRTEEISEWCLVEAVSPKAALHQLLLENYEAMSGSHPALWLDSTKTMIEYPRCDFMVDEENQRLGCTMTARDYFEPLPCLLEEKQPLEGVPLAKLNCPLVVYERCLKALLGAEQARIERVGIYTFIRPNIAVGFRELA